MKIKALLLLFGALLLTNAFGKLSAQPQNASGTWKAEIETPVGTFKYNYLIQQKGETLSGKIISESDSGKREVDLKEGKISGDAATGDGIRNYSNNC